MHAVARAISGAPGRPARACRALVLVLGLLGPLACTPAPAAAPRPEAARADSAPGSPAAATGDAATSVLAPLPERVSLRLAYTTATPSMGGFWAAQQGGYFTRYGIDAEVVFVRAGAEVLAAMASGEVPIAVAGGLSIVAASLEGSDHVILGSMASRLSQSLYTVPTVRSVADLRGQAVGVSRFGAITHLGAIKVLELNGLRAGEDVSIVQTGGIPESLAALQTGAVQGAMLTPPNTLHARRAGMTLLVDTAELNIPDLGSALGSTRRYVREHPAVVDRYLAAVIEGLHRFLADREFALDVIGQYTRTDDREMLGEAWDYYRNAFERDLEPTRPGLQSQLDELVDSKPNARTASPEQFLDLAPLDRVRATGLVQRLYGTQ